MDKWVKEGRIKNLPVTIHVLGEMFKESTAWRVTKGIPRDALCLGVFSDAESQVVYLRYAHSSFESIGGADIIPRYPSAEAEALILRNIQEEMGLETYF
jgi:hypothetical protein